jgi:hypothetical protein
VVWCLEGGLLGWIGRVLSGVVSRGRVVRVNREGPVGRHVAGINDDCLSYDMKNVSETK